MQLTSSTVLGTPSNSNGSPANNPVTTTAQPAARSSATGRRPSPTVGLPAVIIPPGSRLPDLQVTYPDLPSGPHHVERLAELLRIPDGRDVRVIKRFVKFVDDPESVAVIVAVPTGRPGVMRPVLGITHRKLRHLFNVAINWCLIRDRLRFQDGAIAMYTFTSSLENVDETIAMLPEELSSVDVRSDGLNFDPPAVRLVEPQTLGRRLVSGTVALIVAALFVKLLMVSVTAVLQATNSDVYVHAVHATAGEVDAAFTAGALIVYTTARAVREQVTRQTLRIAAFIEDM